MWRFAMTQGKAMRPLRVAFVAGVLAAAPGAVAQEAEPVDPDWPCVQRKVPSLTPAAVWTGPAIDGADDWRQDDEVADLVVRLSQRRVPLEEAEAEIAEFAEALPENERDARLTALFAGLFQTMNAERGEIIEGIERFARRQKELAEEIRRMSGEGGDTTRSVATEAERELYWAHRIFEERRRSLPYICEVPRLVERRLFALGRTIGQALRD